MEPTVRLRALRTHPCRNKVQRKGEIYFASPADAKVVVALGWAEEKPAKVVRSETPPAPTEAQKSGQSKTQYKRRDMTAES